MNYYRKIIIVFNSSILVPKKQRIELFYLKGKVSDILPDYSKFAEEALTKAVHQLFK